MFQRGNAVFGCINVCFFLVLLWCSVVGSGSRADSAPQSDDDWVDPGQMVSDEYLANRAKHEKRIKNEEKQENSAAPTMKEKSKPDGQKKMDVGHFKQLTRIILEAFPTPGRRHAAIELSEHDLTTLRDFKRDTKGEKLYDVWEIIIAIFKHVEEEEEHEQSFFAAVVYNKEIFAVVFIVSVLISILILFEIRTTMSWYRQCCYLFGYLIIISIPWEWFRLYRKAYAEKQAEFMKVIPSACFPRNMTIMERFSLWMAGTLSWKRDECIAYQESILVDPLWEVSPSVALSITITRVFFDPFVHIADSCGKSLNAFLSNVPTAWQPFMLILITVIFLLCLLLLTNSRIRLGFFEIGRVPAQVRRLEREDMDALRECIRREIMARRGINAPVGNRNLEEFPNVQRAVQEERAQDHDEASGVQEYSSNGDCE